MDIGKGVQEGLNQTSAAQKVGTLSSIEQKRSQEMIEKSGETEKIPKSSTIVTTVAPAATIVNKPTENHIAPEKNSKKKLGIDESNNITNNDSNIDRSSNNSSTSASSNSRTAPTSITTTTSIATGSDKSKFKFPLSTRLQDDANFKVTPEALIEAAGEGADTLLVDGKMRRGKWTKEEEKYAGDVIRDFQEGVLHNAEVGITLRSLLADKLLCDPMRISKKFAGKACVGKQVYVVGNMSKFSAKELASRREMLEKSRLVFFEKVRLQQLKSRNRKSSASKKNKKITSNVLPRVDNSLADSAEIQNLSNLLDEHGSSESNQLSFENIISDINKLPPKKKRRKSNTSSLSLSGSKNNNLSTSKLKNNKGGNRSSLKSNKKRNVSKKKVTNTGTKDPAGDANRSNSTNKNKTKRRRVKKNQQIKKRASNLNPSESVLCLQSFISEDNDLQVDMTMFHPEKEEAILGIQF